MAAYEEIVRELLPEIVQGRWKPGESLPKFDDLAREHRRSKTPVREALRALEERSLVSVKHGVAAIVQPDRDWDVLDQDVLMAMLDSGQGVKVLEEYLEARHILEVEAAGLAADRATAEDLKTLTDAFTHMTEMAERAQETEAAERRYQHADIEFHRAIVVATGNRALIRMTKPVHAALETAFPRLARPPDRFERGLPEHKRILAAIVDRDPDTAREAMREHLRTVEGYLNEYASARGER
jgi:DNA-binding FadR family transcriptional regulator